MPLSAVLEATLPDPSTDPPMRAKRIRDAQDTYVWDWSWPPGCATARKVPEADHYQLRYIAEIARLGAVVKANQSALALEGAERRGPLAPPTSARELFSNFFSAAEDFHAGAPRYRPSAAADYARYFAAIPAPPLVAHLRARPEDVDLMFAWQRVGGANPMALRRVAKLPEDMPVTERHWTAAMGAGSLAAALDDGRVFAVDFTFLHGAPTTRYLGRQKYLCGARGVFATAPGPLRPVAIQLEPGGAVFTPADGSAWAMARYCLQVADANVHETMEHLGTTHLVMEALGVAARRTLSTLHPLSRLLEPHLEGTFAINESAKTSLVAPEGTIDRVFAARIDVAAGLCRVALDRFSLQDRAPALELAARGVDDRATLPEYPYRDDATAVYAALERFVDAYVRIYYADDAAVAGDPELRAWVAEVASPIGGALRNVRPVESVAALVTWMTNAVHIASIQHAAVNFPQFPFFGWGANTAGACWGPPPTSTSATDADLLALMPPWDCLFLQSDSVYQLSNVYYNRLGDYGAFFDRRAAAAVSALGVELAALDASIAAQDVTRRLSYPFLRPSLIPASINI